MSPRTLPLPPEPRFRFPRPSRILRRVFRKSVLQALFLFFFTYCLFYVFLSAGGQWSVVKDQVEWNPYGLRFDLRRNEQNEFIVRGSFFGHAFAPLILVDRMTLHRSFPLDSPEGRAIEKQEQQTKVNEWHLQNSK